MKKIFLMFSMCLLLNSITSSAQIKIGGGGGTPDASAILDASNVTAATAKKGFLGPKVALTGTGDVATVPTPTAGLMVFNTAAAGTGTTAVTAGYYYFDGTQWQQMVSSAASGNIYTVDGTLTGNRTLSNGGFKLNLNTKVGLGTSTPASQLEIPFSTAISSLATDSGYVMLGSAGAVHSLLDFHSIQSKNNATTAGSFLINPLGGNVGIGTSAPGAKLELAGTGSTFGSGAFFNNTTASSGRKFSVASRSDFTNGTGQNGMFVIADETVGQARMVLDQAGNVGIGTTTPVTKLDVKGAGSAFPVTSGTTQSGGLMTRLRDGSNLTLDMGGNGSNGIWLQSTDVTNLGSNLPLLLNPNGGNIGVGITAPVTKLDVAGAVGFNGATTNGQLRSTVAGTLNLNIGNTSLNIDNNAGSGTLMSIINASGNVGIGTTNQKNKLDVQGGIAALGAAANPTGNGVTLSSESSFDRLQSFNARPLAINPLGNTVGIGTSTPTSNLDILNNGAGGTTVIASNTSNIALRLSNNGNAQAIMQVITAKDAFGNSKTVLMGVNPTYNGGNGALVIGRVAGSADFGIDLVTGNVGFGTATPGATLDVNGNIRANGNISGGGFTNTSDARLKTDIVPVTNALVAVMKLNPVDYNKKESINAVNYNMKEIGFLAQDIRKIFPELVFEAKDTYKTLSVNYIALIPVLTKAIQEQQAQITDLKNANIVITKQNAIITAQLTDMKDLKIAMAAMQNELTKMAMVNKIIVTGTASK